MSATRLSRLALLGLAVPLLGCGSAKTVKPAAAPAPVKTADGARMPAIAGANGAAKTNAAATAAPTSKAAVPEKDTPRVSLKPTAFDDALSAFYDGDYAEAAAGFWTYLQLAGESAPNREWARFFVAESLRSLGFFHAAVYHYTAVARTRGQPETLPEALARLEEITRTRPFSETWVYERLLYESDFGYLPPAIADWVRYVQGLYDYRNGFTDWGDAHFSAIAADSPYAQKAAYVRAVDAVKKGADEEAVKRLAEVASAATADAETRNLAHMALARLHMDANRYAEAQKEYDQVVQINLSFDQAELLLEKAWAAYGLADYRKAMGYLQALSAPSYADYFLPEAPLLRGLIFDKLCHFLLAKQSVRWFKTHYRRTLEALKRRDPLESIAAIREAGSQSGTIGRRTAFLRTLKTERLLVDDYRGAWEDSKLDQHLRTLYDLEIKEQLRRWRLELDDTAKDAARQLLETEDQLRLLDYEVGLDIFKRLKAAQGRKEKEEALVVPYDSAHVYYEHDSEYWNDELHSYEYFIANRCFDENGGAR